MKMLMNSFRANKRVFFGSLILIFGAVAWTVAQTAYVSGLFSSVQEGITRQFGWFYILVMTAALVFSLILCFSRYGRIRLGEDADRPEFSTLTWFAMLFSAGMGIGLLFYGVAEPIMHFHSPLEGRAEGLGAARQALGVTVFHWGLHPWACYSMIGLALGYFSFRKRLPLSIRSIFYPLLGERIHGFWGDLVDTLAIVSTLFGVATSLGLGAMQVNAGINFLFGVEISGFAQMIIIAVITLFATISVVTGLKAGIRRLSEANMLIALILLLFVFFAGSSRFLVNAFVENIGVYLQTLPINSFWTASMEKDGKAWLSSWTIFYWAWWIAWSPFVGMFIARISRGRTIREFILGVLLAPTLVGLVWFTVFGSTAIRLDMLTDGSISAAVNENVSTAIFVFLQNFPWAAVTGFLATLCITLFFVTSSDSASLVIDIISSGGAKNPPVGQRIFWAVSEGLVAAVLLAAGGLKALQTAAITSALPFSIVLVFIGFALSKALREEDLTKLKLR